MGKRESLVKNFICVMIGILMTAVIEMGDALDVFAAPDIVVVNATNVNVRSEANTSSKTYGKVTKGTMLNRSEERADGWSCIDYAGKSAYIKSEFLTPYTMSYSSIPPISAADSSLSGISLPVTSAASAVTAAAAAPTVTKSQPTSSGGTVWVPRTGTKYHRSSNCSNMKSPRQMSESDAINAGYSACKKCYR